MNDKLNKLFSVSPLKITVLIILLAVTLSFLNPRFLRFMELKTLDLRILSRGVIPSGGETVIATIDEKSLTEMGRWPWPRTTIAKLVEMLKKNDVKAVGLDVVFAEPDQNSKLNTINELTHEVRQTGMSDADAALVKAIKEAKNVTLGYFFHTSSKEVSHLTVNDIEAAVDNISGSKYAKVETEQKVREASMIHAYAAVPNLKEISAVGANSGYFNAYPDSDGVIRWSPLVIKFHNSYYAPLALSLVMQYLDRPAVVLYLGKFGVKGIKINKVEIPTDETGRLLINYLGPARTFPHYSITDIINNRISPDKLRGKIVIVGTTATGIDDLRVTPFSTVYPGVEIHATVIDNILHNNFLKQTWWIRLLDIVSIIFVGLIMGIFIPKLKAVQGMIVSILLMGAFIMVNLFLFYHFNMWLNLIYPVLTMMVVYLAISILRNIDNEKQSQKL